MSDDELAMVGMVWEMVGLLGPILDKARTAGLVSPEVEARLADLHQRLTEVAARL